MELQDIIVVLIIAGAFYYLLRKLFFKPTHDSGSCDKCEPGKSSISKSKKKA